MSGNELTAEQQKQQAEFEEWLKMLPRPLSGHDDSATKHLIFLAPKGTIKTRADKEEGSTTPL